MHAAFDSSESGECFWIPLKYGNKLRPIRIDWPLTESDLDREKGLIFLSNMNRSWLITDLRLLRILTQSADLSESNHKLFTPDQNLRGGSNVQRGVNSII